MINQTQKKVKAEIAIVKLGCLEFEGLLAADGQFGIAVPQICSVFSIDQNQATRTIKSLLGKDTNIDKWFTTFRKNYTNVLLLPEFEKLLFELALKQNYQAINISRALIGLSLQQLFSDAFNIHFDKIDRQIFLEERLNGIVTRRTLTDAIKDYLDTHICCLSYVKYIYANTTDALYLGLFNRKAKQLKIDWECDNPRDAMTARELRYVENVEDLAARLIDDDKIEPVRAVNEALERLMIPTITR